MRESDTKQIIGLLFVLLSYASKNEIISVVTGIIGILYLLGSLLLGRENK